MELEGVVIIYWKYFKYIVEHKKNVFKECIWMSKSFHGKRKLNLILHGFAHDLSKFNPKEFIPYARHFYGDYISRGSLDRLPCVSHKDRILTKEQVEEDFEVAWKHHYMNNKHHWDYWCYDSSGVELDIPRTMPLKYILQMICDWNAMSAKFGGTSKEFYLKNYDSIKLDRFSRLTLDWLLSMEIEDYEE